MALSPDMLQEYFEQAQKCKVSGNIEQINIINDHQCGTDIKIIVNGENNNFHFINGNILKENCTFDSYYKVFLKDDLKIGTEVKYILDEENYQVLSVSGDNANTENIPFCTENKIEMPKNNYNFEIFSGIIFLLIIGFFIFKFYKKK